MQNMRINDQMISESIYPQISIKAHLYQYFLRRIEESIDVAFKLKSLEIRAIVSFDSDVAFQEQYRFKNVQNKV